VNWSQLDLSSSCVWFEFEKIWGWRRSTCKRHSDTQVSGWLWHQL